MKSLVYYLLIIIPTTLQFNLQAQPAASLYFTTAFPMGEFKDFLPKTGFGASAEFFFFSPTEKTPFGAGISLSYISYGAHFLTDPYLDELSLSFNKANNFASVHLLFQIAPHSGSVRPYIETVFGGTYIYSKTDYGYDYYEDFLLIDDWAWNYGAGVGLKFLSIGDKFFNPGSVYIDFKVRYLFGTTTEYLDRNSVEVYYDGIYYSTIESKTDMITASIGLYFFF